MNCLQQFSSMDSTTPLDVDNLDCVQQTTEQNLRKPSQNDEKNVISFGNMASNNLQNSNDSKSFDSGPEDSACKLDHLCGVGSMDITVSPNISKVDSLYRKNMEPQLNEELNGDINSLKAYNLNCEEEDVIKCDRLNGPLLKNSKFHGNKDNCLSNTGELTVDKVLVEAKDTNTIPNSTEVSNLHSVDCNLFSIGTNSANVLRSLSDNSVVISNNNALPQTETIVSSNRSLAQLAVYESDDSTDENVPDPKQQYREVIELDSDKGSESDSSSSSSSSSILISSDSSDDVEDVDGDEEVGENKKESVTPKRPIKGKQELDLEDLPPIEELEISVPEEQCVPVGKVFQIVDRLVVVQTQKGVPAYDLDTVLFVEGGQPLGKIFDVLGPVSEPYYCIRFNSREQIDEKKISLGQMVYSAPETKHTNYVFLTQLMKAKGSDASWEDDLEPPENCIDYSDDEQESLARKKGQRNRKDKPPVGSDPDEPARKRHFAYEKKMNRRNLKITADKSQGRGPNKWGNGRFSNMPMFNQSCSNMPPPTSFQGFCNQMFGKPPMFSGIIAQRALPTVPMTLSPGLGYCHPPETRVSSHEVIQTPASRINFSNAPGARFPIPDITTPPPMQNFCNIPGSGFTSQDFIRTPPPSPNSSDIFRPYPPGVNHNTGQSYQFPPPPPMRLSNNMASGRRSITEPVNNAWVNFPPPPGSPAPNSPLLSSPFWIHNPHNSAGSNVSPNALLHRPERPQPPPQRPFWPTQSAPVLGNSSQMLTNFNPLVPPPSPSDQNQHSSHFKQRKF